MNKDREEVKGSGRQQHTQTQALLPIMLYFHSAVLQEFPQLSTAAAFKQEVLVDAEIQYVSAVADELAGRSSLLCTCCIACSFLHRLTSAGISVHVTWAGGVSGYMCVECDL